MTEKSTRKDEVRNKVKQFIDGMGITIYRFRKDTGIANKTAYDLYNNPMQYPNKNVMRKMCAAYRKQPGDFLEHVFHDE